MYIPAAFAAPDVETALALMDAHPFATLIATGPGGVPFVSHLPLLAALDEDGAVRLTGHMARANPQWRIFAAAQDALAIFHGPHAYVTPRWYARPDVPTWNYAVVHVRGPLHLVEEAPALVGILARMSERFESGASAPWRFEIPDDLRGEGVLASAIVGFEVRATHVRAKLKLSQNRSAADRAGVVAGLTERSDDASRGVRALMRALEERRTAGARSGDPSSHA